MARNSKGLFSAEDWQCMMCSNINWARRDTCNQCGHPKEGKSEERHGVGGGFKENDNVQYRTRTNDEVCPGYRWDLELSALCDLYMSMFSNSLPPSFQWDT